MRRRKASNPIDTPAELRREGFRALVDRLGPADAIRYLQQFDPGEGVYVQERREWLDSLTLDEILRDIEAMKQGASERGGV